MKIAILTLPLHLNYGGNIQCYALITTLQRMGHEAINIRLVKDILLPPLKERPYLYTKRFINKLLGRKHSCVFAEQKLIRERDVVHKYADEFISRHIPSTPHAYKDVNSLKELNNHSFDAFIVGSDQVWRPKYAFPNIHVNFLDFLYKHVLRISYAASFGSDNSEYSELEIKECGSLIEKFDAISVREKSAISLIQNTFGWKCKNTPQFVLDPTMLLNKEDYLKIVPPYDNKSSNGKLFFYILDMTPDKKKSLDHICMVKNLESFTTYPRSTFSDNKVEEKSIPPVEAWIQGFENASMIVTDSFHGCVFSILFNKPFIVYANHKRGLARFKSLLNLFELEDRLVISFHSLSEKNINAPINWDRVNTIREKMKQESIDFLNNALSHRKRVE